LSLNSYSPKYKEKKGGPSGKARLCDGENI
jgi:hypothetical protein